MRVGLWSILSVLGMLGAACAPEQECGGQLVFDPVLVSCRPCPMDAEVRDGKCVCASGKRLSMNRCVGSAEMETNDEDAGAAPDTDAAADASATGASCADYCGFAKTCFADNALATAAIPDVVEALHANDPAACVDSCGADTAGTAEDPVVACIEAGRVQAACAGDSTQAGLVNAVGLIDSCCQEASGNELCSSICDALTANMLVRNMIDFCD